MPRHRVSTGILYRNSETLPRQGRRMNPRQRRERDQEADFIAKHYNHDTRMVIEFLPTREKDGGTPMPDTQLPTTELAARPMFAPLDSSLAGLVERYSAVRAKPLTRMVVESATELDTDP